MKILDGIGKSWWIPSTSIELGFVYSYISLDDDTCGNGGNGGSKNRLCGSVSPLC